MSIALAGVIRHRYGTYYRSNGYDSAGIGVSAKNPRLLPWSVIFEYDIRDGSGRQHPSIIAKVRRAEKFGRFATNDVGDQTVRALQGEYARLSDAYRFFASRGDELNVVRPLDYLDEWNAMIVEKAAGKPLDSWLRCDPASARLQFVRCGRWLRLFHNGLHEQEASPWKPADFRSRLRVRRQRLEALGVSSSSLSRVFTPILEVLTHSKAESVPSSILHGDFKLRHVWGSQGGIQVLDLGNTTRGHCHVDVAAFAVQMILFAASRTRRRRQEIRACCDALLDAYFGSDGPPTILPVYLVDCLLKMWDRKLYYGSDSHAIRAMQKLWRPLPPFRTIDRLCIGRWFERQICKCLTADVGRWF